MAITPLPTPPSRADSASFAARADAFLAALQPFAVELGATADDVTAKQGIASTAATTATTKAGEASSSATSASASAGTAATKASEASSSAAAALASKNAAGTSAINAADSATAAANSAASVDPQNLAADYAGVTEPVTKWPYMTWADTSSMLFKRRNAPNTAWVVEGPLLLPMATLQWVYGHTISEIFYLRDDITGAGIPPTDNPLFRYIRLTASDAYNAGVLTGETITGSGATINAQANVSLAGSSLNGAMIHLLNTERRVIRAGSAGVVEQDAGQRIVGTLGDVGLSAGVTVGYGFKTATGPFSLSGTTDAYAANSTMGNSGYRTILFDSAGGARTSDETRVKSIGATAYMRVL